MKYKLFPMLIAVISVMLIVTACEQEEKEKPPTLPPYESMAVDFSSFMNQHKSTDAPLAGDNFTFAKNTVGFWNLLLTVNLVVPVQAFYQSFRHSAAFLGENTWQWTYNVTGFSATYTARLVGKLRENDIKWEMYIAKAGIDPFNEFLWYEGTSARDGMSGQWILYHSHEFQEKVLQIDWEKESDQIASLTYTALRELKDDRTTEPFKGSYLTYGLQEGDYNAFYNVHFYDIWTTSFVDAYIDWSTTEYNGRVKAQYHFQDTEWHCWDNSGADALCN